MHLEVQLTEEGSVLMGQLITPLQQIQEGKESAKRYPIAYFTDGLNAPHTRLFQYAMYHAWVRYQEVIQHRSKLP